MSGPAEVHLLPRLSAVGVRALLEHGDVQSPLHGDGRYLPPQLGRYVSYAATGGSPKLPEALRLGRAVRELAISHGFPTSSRRKDLAAFDAAAAILLATDPVLQSGEALRADVWAFLATAVLPEVVQWRFSSPPAARYDGGVRNTFQRLWFRGRGLDRGEGNPMRWELLSALSEDAMVQIFERPTLAAEPVLTLALGEAILRAGARVPASDFEAVIRRGVKIVRLRQCMVDLVAMSPEDRGRFLDGVFASEVELGWASEPDTVPSRLPRAPRSYQSLVTELEELAYRHRLISPNSKRAIELLRAEEALDSSARNALGYLLERLAREGPDAEPFRELLRSKRRPEAGAKKTWLPASGR